MIQIYLSNLYCYEETSELSASDEPYVLVTSVDLASTVIVQGFPVPLPAYDVVRYGPFEDVDEDERHFAPGISQSFWGINGRPAALADPDQVIFVVALMEHDAGRPGTLQGIVKGIVSGSVFGSLSLDRGTKVTTLIRDVSSALGTPSGPSLDQDDPVGEPQELRFSREELALAESGQTVTKELDFSGAGGHYALVFEARNPSWRHFELAATGNASGNGSIAAVSRIPNSMEIFWVGAEGSVEDAFWYEGMDHFGRHTIAPNGSASPNGGITVVSRIPNSMEIFWVGAEGSVEDAVWYEGMDHWARFAIVPNGSASPNGGITAVSRIPESMEIWWIGANRFVQDAFWYA
jgi:hypothetical protein